MCLVLREGAGADARMLRSQAEAFVKAEIFNFCRLFRAERLDEVLQNVDQINFAVEGNPGDLAQEVRTLFEAEWRLRVLLVGGEEWMAFCREAAPEAKWLVANNTEDALLKLGSDDVDLALLDLWLGRPPGTNALLAHMGDSRAYLLHDGKFQQRTHDHSLVQLLIDTGDITPQEAAEHPSRGQITRYVGMPGEALPEVLLIDIAAGDRLLLCTDGLTGMVPEQELCDIMLNQRTPRQACRALIAAANEAGGLDNITALVVDVH